MPTPDHGEVLRIISEPTSKQVFKRSGLQNLVLYLSFSPQNENIFLS